MSTQKKEILNPETLAPFIHTEEQREWFQDYRGSYEKVYLSENVTSEDRQKLHFATESQIYKELSAFYYANNQKAKKISLIYTIPAFLIIVLPIEPIAEHIASFLAADINNFETRTTISAILAVLLAIGMFYFSVRISKLIYKKINTKYLQKQYKRTCMSTNESSSINKNEFRPTDPDSLIKFAETAHEKAALNLFADAYKIAFESDDKAEIENAFDRIDVLLKTQEIKTIFERYNQSK